ncbi:MAG: DUF1553 domain-containing protein [Planctomycetaceae bacterium]|nr:DUF1553 domain-containing protein [Planctomycetaceae bacterium]MBT5882759.1 DUF1553 domain-containing protein [Planctomycetaceae bacterium]
MFRFQLCSYLGLSLWILLSTPRVLRADVPVDFQSEVMPMLTRAGCNAGDCHGSAVGRGGFHLSLLGSSPARDFAAITNEFKGRRVNLKHPGESLVLKKPTGYVDHGGGIVLDEDSAAAALLERWIAEGARETAQRKLVQFHIGLSSGNSIIAKGQGGVVRALATFSDGTQLDVTDRVTWSIQDKDALHLDTTTGELTALRSGQHVLIARFMNQVKPLMVLVPFNRNPDELAVDYDLSTLHRIDQEIVGKLMQLNLEPQPRASSATLVRRVYLDLTGQLPTVDATRDYIADTDPNKYTNLFTDLLGSREFIDYWSFYLARMLQIRPQAKSDTAARAYYQWIRQQLQQQPYNLMVRTLVLSQGTIEEQPATEYYRTVRGAREQAELTSELFMGVRLRCANCHNHPLDRWTQDDYHGLAAVFAKVRQGARVQIVSRGEVTHPATGAAAIPKIPGDRYINVSSDQENVDLRVPFVNWLTSPNNSYFAKSAVNRIWSYLMGRGLVNPVSNMSETNPASHTALLQWLADDFVDHDFDIQHTIRQIMTSDAYQRRVARNASLSQQVFYRGYLARPLPPEVLLDAISDVTGVATEFTGFKATTRAIQIPYQDIPSTALDAVGRCTLEQCGSVVNAEITIAQRLQWINGALINDKLNGQDSFLRQLQQQSQNKKISVEKLIQELYVRVYSRLPKQTELVFWRNQLTEEASTGKQIDIIRDLLWSLMASREFGSQH